MAAGLAAACVAVPLNVALALACGVPASVGLSTGIVAGMVAAWFGGARLQITGPEAALVPISAEIVRNHGAAGLALSALACGLIQIALGALRVGRAARLVPHSVVLGFTGGIGLWLLNRQAPRVLGNHDESLSAVLTGLRLPPVQVEALMIGAVVVVCMVLVPKLRIGIPGVLVGIVLATLLGTQLGANTEVVGELPSKLPAITLPVFQGLDLIGLAPLVLALVVVSSLGSLMAASALDSLTQAKGESTSDPDQELIAQGLANAAAGLVGGMPVMGAIVRSTVAVDAGARTRAAPVYQALWLAAAVLVGGPAIAVVPLVALGAVLTVVGYRLLNVKAFAMMWRSSQSEALIATVTAIATVTMGFLQGIVLGLALAGIVRLVRASRVQIDRMAIDSFDAGASGGGAPSSRPAIPEISLVRVRGPLTFLSQTQLFPLLEGPPWPRYIVIDLAGVPFADAGGLNELKYLAEFFQIRGTKVALAKVPSNIAQSIRQSRLYKHFLGETAYPTVDDALAVIARLQGRLVGDTAPQPASGTSRSTDAAEPRAAFPSITVSRAARESSQHVPATDHNRASERHLIGTANLALDQQQRAVPLDQEHSVARNRGADAVE